MKSVIDTLEKFCAYNAKAKETKHREVLHSVMVNNGYKFASNGFYILAVKSNESATKSAPDPAAILKREKIAATITLDIDDFEQALHNAYVFAREESGMVTMVITNELVTLYAKSEEFGSMTRVLPSARVMDGSAGIAIAFNVEYARNCSRYIAGKHGNVTLEIKNCASPIIFVGDDENKIAALMPMKVDTFNDALDGITSAYCPALPGVRSYVFPGMYYTDSEGRFKWSEWESGHHKGETWRESEPLPNAVECDALTCWKSSDRYDNAIVLNFRNPRKIAPAHRDERPTKSELMTALNKERARIRREFKNMPITCKQQLQRLYRAFGNLQRKNWKEHLDHAPRPNGDTSLEWVTLKETRSLYAVVVSLRPIDVTDEFSKISVKEPSHV